MIFIGALTTPGVLYLLMKLGNPAIISLTSGNGLMTSFIGGSYGWLFGALFLPGLYLSSRLILAFYVAIDTNLSAIDSLKKSWEITGERQGLFFAFQIVFTFVGAVPYLGWLLSLFIMAIHIYLYRKLSK